MTMFFFFSPPDEPLQIAAVN